MYLANNYTDSFAGDPYNIASGKPLSAAGVNAALNTREKVANKTDAIDSNNSSSSAQYPSIKAVYDSLNGANNDIVHKVGAETLTGVKTFGTASAAAEPLLGMAKTTDAVNDGTKFATEAQIYKAVQGVDILPVGTILAMSTSSWTSASTVFKSKWKVCDGTNGMPDLRGRFLRGGTASDPLTGDGKKTLSINEMPEHAHGLEGKGEHDHADNIRYVTNNWSNDHGLAGATFSQAHTNYDIKDGGHTHTVEFAGGGQAFDVVPAFYTVIYIMKVS